MNIHDSGGWLAAFDVAEELLDTSVHEIGPYRQHMNTLLFLSHLDPDMLQHSCLDIAAAAILTCLRLQSGPAAAAAAEERLPRAIRGERARECGERMLAMLRRSAGELRPSAAA